MEEQQNGAELALSSHLLQWDAPAVERERAPAPEADSSARALAAQARVLLRAARLWRVRHGHTPAAERQAIELERMARELMEKGGEGGRLPGR